MFDVIRYGTRIVFGFARLSLYGGYIQIRSGLLMNFLGFLIKTQNTSHTFENKVIVMDRDCIEVFISSSLLGEPRLVSSLYPLSVYSC
jgi:hypothetical protein